jgi:hypothetical protein
LSVASCQLSTDIPQIVIVLVVVLVRSFTEPSTPVRTKPLPT